LEDRTLLSFAKPVPYTTGGSPSAVAVGDFDGDHTPDIAVADFSSGSISVFQGKGDGTFQTPPKVDSGLTTNVVAMAAADLNGDGKDDLVVVDGSANSSSIDILLSNGDGTFQPPVTYTVGGFPNAVAVGDLSGDGRKDIAVACAGTYDSTTGTVINSGVSVLINQGNGTFGPATLLSAGPSPSSVVIANFDGVNGNDLAVGNSGSGVVDVLLNQGDGTFQPAVSYTHGSDAALVAAADFNGDHKPDLVSASTVFNGPVSVWLNKEDGTFPQTPVDYPAGSGSKTQSLAVADLDGNGTADIVTESRISGGYVLLSRGDGTFGPPAYTNEAGSQVVLADLNGDNAPDAVSLNDGQTSGFGVLINQPGALHLTGTFNNNSTAGSPNELDITPRDWNGATVTGYSGTVHFTSSDPQAQATLPPTPPSPPPTAWASRHSPSPCARPGRRPFPS
jgi:hypothetical protein